MPTCLHARRSVDKTVGVGAEVHDGFERGYHLHRGSLGTNGVLEVGKHEEVFPGGGGGYRGTMRRTLMLTC